ncbi:MAG: hypothetical protein IJ814_06935 [Paludibacteraceae bacterium]|nr:hypothetical protein [Paludibacteraceae bacterium]
MALAINRLQLEDGSYSQEFELVGVPSSLSFQALHGEKSVSWGVIQPNYASLVVEQYARISNLWGWYSVYNNVVGTTETASGDIALDETATKIRFRTTEQETYHTITDIRVPRKKFMRADVEEIYTDVEANTIWSKNITISHSNIDLMTVTTTQGIIALSSSTIGGGCGDFGDDVLTVSYTPMDKNVEYFDTIVITDGKAEPSTIVIPVRLYSRGLNQSIIGFELPETCEATDESIFFTATASSELEVKYLSSDNTIAYVNEENKLVILSSGEVSITAYQDGNEKYDAAAETKTIVISKAETTIYSNPAASDINLGEALSASVLTGGEASVAGWFEWADGTIVPEDGGENYYRVVFIPENSAIYSNQFTEVAVYVIQTTDDPATSVDEVNGEKANGEWMKVLRNGQILIIREGKAYTITGELVR